MKIVGGRTDGTLRCPHASNPHLGGIASLISTGAHGAAEELKLIAWNVESGTPRANDPAEGSDPETIAEQLQVLTEYDIVGLSEVRPSAADQFVDALSEGSDDTYLSIHSATGMDDRLLLAWRANRLQLLAGYEMHRHGDFLLNSLGEDGNWRHRRSSGTSRTARRTWNSWS